MSIFTARAKPPEVDADALWSSARELVRRGPPFVPAEAAALGAAFPFALDRPIRDGLDVLTVQTCARFPRPSGTAAPQGPTPLDAAIAAAEAELEAVETREREARAEHQRRSDAAAQVANNPARWEARMAEVAAALEAYQAVDAVWLRVRSRVTALHLSRTRWRIEQGA